MTITITKTYGEWEHICGKLWQIATREPVDPTSLTPVKLALQMMTLCRGLGNAGLFDKSNRPITLNFTPDQMRIFTEEEIEL